MSTEYHILDVKVLPHTHVSVEGDDPQAVMTLDHVCRVVSLGKLHGSGREPSLVLPERGKMIVVPKIDSIQGLGQHVV